MTSHDIGCQAQVIILPQTMVAVPNIGRNIYLLRMPQYSVFKLKLAKAEISCPKCKNIPSKRHYENACEECNGDGSIEYECEICDG